MTIDPIIEKAFEKWSEQGRTEDQIWAVRNFLTGAGGIAIASYGSEQRKLGKEEARQEIVNEYNKYPFRCSACGTPSSTLKLGEAYMINALGARCFECVTQSGAIGN